MVVENKTKFQAGGKELSAQTQPFEIVQVLTNISKELT